MVDMKPRQSGSDSHRHVFEEKIREGEGRGGPHDDQFVDAQPALNCDTVVCVAYS